MRTFHSALIAAALLGAACSDSNEPSTGASGTGGDGHHAGSGGADGEGGQGGGPLACLTTEMLQVIEDHIDEIVASAQLNAGHPGELEATGFLLAPGLPSPPAVSNLFAGPLVQGCSTAMMYDPYCDQGNCSRIECTGDGAGWIMHVYLDSPPFTKGDWTFTDARVDESWADGATGVTFTLETKATGPGGVDWSVQGAGEMDLASLVLEETFPKVFPEGPAVLTLDSTPDATTGTIVVEGVTVAETNAQGHFVVTGACP
jgi:hypothetical protein